MLRAVKYGGRAIVLLFLLCAGAFAQDSRANNAAKTLHDFFAAEWDYQMEQHPTWASSLGDRRWNDRWSDSSLGAIYKRHNHDIATLSKLTKIDRAALSPSDQLNYDLFKKDYENDIEDFQYRWYLLPLNQLGGVHTVNQLAETLRFDTLKDYEDWLARLKALSVRVDQTIALMRLGMKERIILPKIVVQRVPAQIDHQIVSDPKRPDKAVEMGISCMGCHIPGVHSKADQMHDFLEKNPRAIAKADADIAMGLTAPMDYTELPFSVRWTGKANAGEKDTLRFRYNIAPANINEGENNRISLGFAALATNSKGQPLGQFSKIMEGDLTPELAAGVRAKGLSFDGSIDLPPGSDESVRFLVRDNLSGKMGSVTVTALPKSLLRVVVHDTAFPSESTIERCVVSVPSGCKPATGGVGVACCGSMPARNVPAYHLASRRPVGMLTKSGSPRNVLRSK